MARRHFLSKEKKAGKRAFTSFDDDDDDWATDDRRRDANRAESRDERVGESGFEAVGAAKRVEQGAGCGRRGERATDVELLGLRVDFFVVDRGGAGT